MSEVLQARPASGKSFGAGAPSPMKAKSWLERHVDQGRVERHTETVDVTSGLATEMLLRNTRNRPISKHRVGIYVERMLAGKWELISDPVVFDREGFMVNGQHRLSAIIAAGVAVPMTVCFGAEHREFELMDQHGVRSMADVLACEGFENRGEVGALSATLLRLRTRQTRSTNQKQDALEMARTIDFETFRRALKIGDASVKFMGGRSPATVAFYLILRNSAATAETFEKFTEEFITGATPMMANLRTAVTGLRLRSMDTSDRLTKIVALVLLAWNAALSRKRQSVKFVWKQVVYLPDPL